MPTETDPKKEAKKPDEIINTRSRSNGRKSTNFESITDYMKGNTKETLSYIFLVVGLLLLLFDPVSGYGGLILGVISGLYFSDELAYLAKNAKDSIEDFGLVKSLTLGAVLLAIFIKIPFLLIGAAAAVAAKIFLWPKRTG